MPNGFDKWLHSLKRHGDGADSDFPDQEPATPSQALFHALADTTSFLGTQPTQPAQPVHPAPPNTADGTATLFEWFKIPPPGSAAVKTSIPPYITGPGPLTSGLYDAPASGAVVPSSSTPGYDQSLFLPLSPKTASQAFHWQYESSATKNPKNPHHVEKSHEFPSTFDPTYSGLSPYAKEFEPSDFDMFHPLDSHFTSPDTRSPPNTVNPREIETTSIERVSGEAVSTSSSEHEPSLAEVKEIQENLNPLKEFVRDVTSTRCASCRKKFILNPEDVIQMTRRWIIDGKSKSAFGFLLLYLIEE